ncbi:competence protein CoiA family protein [Pseudobacillus sp. FSL P4-0506]|uniref:competence protein CoiA n=1 Tax=unclassified Pseudobacillus TaxID=2619284 RepID=UPI0030FBB161
MLVAINQFGQVISLESRLEESVIRKIRDSSYFCPSCRQPVVLKAGAIKMPHFAHQSLRACASFSEGESDRHLKGKADLYKWISRTHKTELEAYLPEMAQRPDLLVEGKVAIEYQCSPLSATLFAKRTKGYEENDIVPFWIYGGPPVKRQNRLYQISAFHRLFFRYSPHFGFWFLAYCPDRQHFILYSQLTPMSPSLYSASVQIIPLYSLSYPPTFTKAHTLAVFSLSDWFRQRDCWLQKQLYFKQGLYDSFFSAVYKTSHHPSLLPLCIGMPVRFMALIKNHPIEWQFYLWNDLLVSKKNAVAEEAVAVIEKRIERGELQMNTFPLCPSPGILCLMTEYLSLWQAVGTENKRVNRTVFERTEREKIFINDFEEFIIPRLIF